MGERTGEITVMEKEIREVENKYSLYFKERKAYQDLYRFTTTTLLVIMSVCACDIIRSIIEML